MTNNMFFQAVKPRVLIVDNDPRARVSYQALLMEWGYDPILAEGSSKKLLDDANAKARDKRCALALIDLRLMDHYDEKDVSGLTLAEDFGASLRPIILSGYENQSVLRSMLRQHKDIIFLSKHDDRDEMRKVFDAEAAKVSAVKREMLFENTDIFDKLIESELVKQLGGYSDQIADLFARLFPDAKKLRFEKMDTHLQTLNISTAPRPNSIILKVYEDELEPCVVKLARAEKIQKEVENYYKFISRKLTGSFAANLLQRAVLWDIGGASYSFVGSDGVRTFSQYYEENSIADIEESLQSFFIGVWKKNYDHAHEQCNVSLFNLYSNVWGEWYEKRVKAFSPADFTGLSGIMQKLNIPNPVEWLKKNIAESPSDISMVASTLLAVTHGDLHGDNLMVDNKKNVWVIDFERCCEGHALQDFIELEADIFNRLEAHNNSASAYLKMCIVVLKQKNIQALETLQAGTEDTHIEKALQTIFVIRSLACQLTGITDARQYLFGLLFNMFFRADIQREKGAQSSMLRSLLIASLICHRLDHWDDETWPPVEWNL